MKKHTKIISLFLIAVLLLSVIALPISASYHWTTDAKKDHGFSYTVKRASAPIVVDGKVSAGEEWQYADDSQAFQVAYVSGNFTALPENEPLLTPTFKAMWYNDGTDAYLYILMTVNDKRIASVGATAWNGDVFQGSFDENGDGTEELKLAAMYLGGRELTEGQVPGISRFTYKTDDRRTSDGTGDGYTVEMQYKFKNAADCSGTVLADFFVADYLENNATYGRYSWNGVYDNSAQKPFGKFAISSDLANPNLAVMTDDAIFYNGETAIASRNKDTEGKITLPLKASERTIAGWMTMETTPKFYAPGAKIDAGSTQIKLKAVFAAPVTSTGASIFIGDGNKLRFEATLPSLTDISSYVTEAGFIFVELAKLTDAILADGVTAEELTAASVEFSAVKAEAIAENIKGVATAKDGDTKYAAISYIKIKYSDNAEVVIYSDFSAENNSRCVSEVAAAAYNDRTSVKTEDYTFKQGKDYGVTNFEIMSYSPYANVQLDVLKKLGKIS
ncbi:MAG: hypothetical protein IKJ00_05445 [Clostridia bacterium]|nr:hypothetical protein [Clostridia bacterium]